MQLIKTHDGIYGLKYEGRPVIWCSDKEEMIRIGWANFAKKATNHGEAVFKRDVETALRYMAENGHTIAHFGVFGSFIFTEL